MRGKSGRPCATLQLLYGAKSALLVVHDVLQRDVKQGYTIYYLYCDRTVCLIVSSSHRDQRQLQLQPL